MNPFLQVAIGGAIGATARYAVYRAVPLHGPGLPIATGLVNVLGSLVMGLLAAFMAHRWNNAYAPLLLTGVAGSSVGDLGVATDERPQQQLGVTVGNGDGADGGGAAGLERGQQGPFGGDGRPGRGVVEFGQAGHDVGALCAALHRQRALPGRR